MIQGNTLRRYDVGLSFAGEDRPYVDKVAVFLRSNGVRVFYDEFEQVRLWGANLTETIVQIYAEDSEFIIPFISLAYREKEWTRLEIKSALQAALKARHDVILPARFDDTEIPGLLSTIGHIDLRKYAPGAFGEMILAKLNERGIIRYSREDSLKVSSTEVPAYSAWRIIQSHHVSEVLSGSGPYMVGTRWSHPEFVSFTQRGHSAMHS